MWWSRTGMPTVCAHAGPHKRTHILPAWTSVISIRRISSANGGRPVRQREPVQAEMTSQRGQVISPADQAALPLVIGAAVARLVRRDPAQAGCQGRLVIPGS